MIVFGTAGHIDHGKSAIVRRLTGTDPDRLPEEKARGMTIDLGFAFYRPAEADPIALVDVPGHERFVKNMIAGAGGIDAVILVIAADDGWMPQSEEHFQITRLLGVRQGLVVINKIDLVEPDWLELLQQDIADKVSGSFLGGAPIIQVSAETGDGFDRLAEEIDKMAAQLQGRTDIGKARLAIDRSFIRPGIGGVVTGTLRGGDFEVGQTVSVWPSMVKGKVRTLQSMGQDVQRAVPGQRTAVSLTGVDRSLLVRGGVITARLDLDYFVHNPILALSLELLHNSPVELTDRRRGLLIIGTTEVEGELRLLHQKKMLPSESGLVFFKPDHPVYALIGDRFIMRLPTPMVTLGGGTLLDHLPVLPRRKELASVAYLQVRLKPGLDSLIVSELQKLILVKADQLLTEADCSQDEIKTAVTALIDQGQLGQFDSALYHAETFQATLDKLKTAVASFLGQQPHLKGLTRDQVAGIVNYAPRVLESLLSSLVEKKLLTLQGELYNLAGRGMSLKGAHKQAYEEIIAVLQSQKYDPPPLSNLAGRGKIHQQAIKYIIESGEGYKCGSSFLFVADAWNEIIDFVKACLSQEGKLVVADLKNQFGLSRKYAIPILEELDRLGLTARQGDFRIKGREYED